MTVQINIKLACQQARIKVTQLQLPYIKYKCPKVQGTGLCLAVVNGEKCSRGHKTVEVGPPKIKLAVWLSFLDADSATSMQRRAFVRPSAFVQITNIKMENILAMNYGFQEAIAGELIGKIFIGQFIVSKKFITLNAFTQ